MRRMRPLQSLPPVTDPEGRRRVVQDAASTHVLVALLATTLVLFIVGWAGNIFARLPTDAQSLEDIVAALRGPKTRFWMGWGYLPDEEGKPRGGENEAGVSQFGIFVVGEEETKSKQ